MSVKVAVLKPGNSLVAAIIVENGTQ